PDVVNIKRRGTSPRSRRVLEISQLEEGMSVEAGGAHSLKRYPVWVASRHQLSARSSLSWTASWVRLFALLFACFIHPFITSRGMAASIRSGRTAGDIPSEYQKSVNPFFLAMSKFRRRRWEEVIDICSGLLQENPRDESAWFLKCRALTMKNFIDDL
ncbi:Tetratricopeptide repeat protein 8, partial [Perkinsus olseni]